MKRVMIVGLIVLAGAIGSVQHVYARSEVLNNDGQSYDPGDDYRKYIRVKNTDTSATSLVNGDVVIWDVRGATNTSNVDRWSVTTTTVASDSRVAGVMVDATAPNRYGFMQTYGIHTAVKVTGQVTPGQALEPSATTTRAQATNAPRGEGLGAALTDSGGTGNTTIQVWIRK